ncbi:MAG: putative toxin-antitoxin system toxin component, PIN family [Nitrospirae bacterium]|nr:putative toxin-antitoxin system toxin component, PIN family [Nitrospirota bacterium]
MILVLDTNVVVSAFLSPHGPPARLVDAAIAGHLALALDARLLAEYRDVLTRPEFGFPAEDVALVLSAIAQQAVAVTASPLAGRLPDRDDEPFLEVALAARADALVTGNIRHFPVRARAGQRVLSPRDCYEYWRRLSASDGR